MRTHRETAIYMISQEVRRGYKFKVAQRRAAENAASYAFNNYDANTPGRAYWVAVNEEINSLSEQEIT